MLDLAPLILRVSTASSTALKTEKRARTVRPCLEDLRTVQRVVSVDPGLQGTGVAEFLDGELVGVWVLNVEHKFAKMEWPDRADLISADLEQIVMRSASTHDTVVVCEMPEFQGGAGRSMGWKTGDLQRLAYLVGMFSGHLHPVRFHPVLVHEWKGQLPKTIVQERLTKKLGVNTCRYHKIDSHAWDAVGIGMWAQGRF